MLNYILNNSFLESVMTSTHSNGNERPQFVQLNILAPKIILTNQLSISINPSEQKHYYYVTIRLQIP